MFILTEWVNYERVNPYPFVTAFKPFMVKDVSYIVIGVDKKSWQSTCSKLVIIKPEQAKRTQQTCCILPVPGCEEKQIILHLWMPLMTWVRHVNAVGSSPWNKIWKNSCRTTKSARYANILTWKSHLICIFHGLWSLTYTRLNCFLGLKMAEYESVFMKSTPMKSKWNDKSRYTVLFWWSMSSY